MHANKERYTRRGSFYLYDVRGSTTEHTSRLLTELFHFRKRFRSCQFISARRFPFVKNSSDAEGFQFSIAIKNASLGKRFFLGSEPLRELSVRSIMLQNKTFNLLRRSLSKIKKISQFIYQWICIYIKEKIIFLLLLLASLVSSPELIFFILRCTLQGRDFFTRESGKCWIELR